MANKAVFCIAQSEEQAVRIVDQLKAAGFSNNDVSVLFPDRTGTRDFAHEQHTKAPEGTATGVAAGGLAGGVLGWLVGIGSLAIPGVGTLHRGRANSCGFRRCSRGRDDRRCDRGFGRSRHSRVRGQAI